MESELFGHERGAFTGADAPRTGRFEMADGGSILLDEVTEIELPLQAKLLRVLQERSFERVGSSQTRHVDVRVLATTNRDLQAEVQRGRFREDLYFRLAVVPLLRAAAARPPRGHPRPDRPFRPALRRAAPTRAVHARRDGPQPAVWNIIGRATSASWRTSSPGRACCTPATPVTADDLRRWLIGPETGPPGVEADSGQGNVPVGISLEEMERRLIEATLEHFGGHRAKTAKALGIGLRTLSGKLRQYGYPPREKIPVAE